MNSVLVGLVKNHTQFLGKKMTQNFKSFLNEKEFRVYELIDKGRKINRVADIVYGKGVSNSTFQKCRNSLLLKVTSSYVCTKRGTTIQRQKIEIWRYIMVCKVLGLFGLKSIWTDIAKKIIKKCQYLDLSYEQIDVCRMLFKYYATQERDLNKAEYYYNRFQMCKTMYDNESIAEWRYCRALNFMTTLDKNEARVLVKNLCKEIEGEQFSQSHRTEFYNRFTIYIGFYLEDDFENIESILLDSIRYFENLEFTHDLLINVFYLETVKIFLEYGRLDKANFYLNKMYDNRPLESVQKYRCIELLFRIDLYRFDIRHALDRYLTLNEQSKKLVEKDANRRLLIYKFYLDIISNNHVNMRMLRYNLNRMKDDKFEIHIPFIIGEIVYYYINDKDKLIDKKEAFLLRLNRASKGVDITRTYSFVNAILKSLENNDNSLDFDYQYHPVANNSIELINYNSLFHHLTKPSTKARKSHRFENSKMRVNRVSL